MNKFTKCFTISSIFSLLLWFIIIGVVYAGVSFVKKDDYTVTKEEVITTNNSTDLDTTSIDRAIEKLGYQITEANQRVTALETERTNLVNAKKLIVVRPVVELNL